MVWLPRNSKYRLGQGRVFQHTAISMLGNCWPRHTHRLQVKFLNLPPFERDPSSLLESFKKNFRAAPESSCYRRSPGAPPSHAGPSCHSLTKAPLQHQDLGRSGGIYPQGGGRNCWVGRWIWRQRSIPDLFRYDHLGHAPPTYFCLALSFTNGSEDEQEGPLCSGHSGAWKMAGMPLFCCSSLCLSLSGQSFSCALLLLHSELNVPCLAFSRPVLCQVNLNVIFVSDWLKLGCFGGLLFLKQIQKPKNVAHKPKKVNSAQKKKKVYHTGKTLTILTKNLYTKSI